MIHHRPTSIGVHQGGADEPMESRNRRARPDRLARPMAIGRTVPTVRFYNLPRGP